MGSLNYKHKNAVKTFWKFDIIIFFRKLYENV